MDEMWNYMPELLPFNKSKTLSIIVFYIYYIVLTIAIIYYLHQHLLPQY